MSHTMVFSAIPLLLVFTLSIGTRPLLSDADPLKPKGRSFGRMIQEGSPYSSNGNEGQPPPQFQSPSPKVQPFQNNNEQQVPTSPGQAYKEKDPFRADFEKYVSTLPISSFEGDAILVQFPDRLNGRTTYRHLDPSAIDTIVYERNEMDADADVVILTGDEDKVPLSKKNVKRVYIVLRRALLLDPRLYYVSYVYVTDPPEGSRGIHNLGDRKVYIEWDFWDHREVDDPTAKQLEYAFGCSNTIFVPCASNETADFPIPKQKPAKLSSVTNGGGGQKPYPGLERRTLYVPEGYDPNEFIDIYWDLEKELQKERVVNTNEQSGVAMPQQGRTFTIKDRIVQGAFFVVGGLSKMIQIGCGLLKSFQGMFGGLGTGEAETGGVTEELGIDGSDNIEALNTPEENQELDAEVKEPTAGGLGGLVSMAMDTLEAAKGRAIGKPWDPIVEEKPYVQFGWRAANDVNSVNDPFVGFGGCRYHRVTQEELEKTVTETDLLRVYKTALKTQCVLYDGEFLQEILNDGLLRSQVDKTFRLVKESPHFQLEKLNVKQLKELLRGVELYMWTKIYSQELRSPSPSTTAPDGSTLSRSVYTLGQAFIHGTALAQQDLYPMRHGFKIGRNMIKTLKRAYLKLLEDISLLGEEDAGFEKEINFNDRLYIMSISQYLIHGVTPVFVENADPYKTFDDFYRKNKPVLEDRVNIQTPL